MSGPRVLTFMIAVFTALASSASAATLPIEGSYGNDAGCRYARTNESEGADVFFLMTPETVTSAASYCEVAKAETSGKDIVAILACEAEGETGITQFPVRITPANKAYTIKFDDGTTWGPLRKC